MLAGYESGVNINRLLIFVEERQGPQELDVLGGNLYVRHISQLIELESVSRQRRETPVLRNQPLKIAVIQTVQKHLFVVATQDHHIWISLGQRNHSFNHSASINTAIDQITKEDDLVASDIPRDVLDQPIEQCQSSVNVAYDVGSHQLVLTVEQHAKPYCRHHRSASSIHWRSETFRRDLKTLRLKSLRVPIRSPKLLHPMRPRSHRRWSYTRPPRLTSGFGRGESYQRSRGPRQQPYACRPRAARPAQAPSTASAGYDLSAPRCDRALQQSSPVVLLPISKQFL